MIALQLHPRPNSAHHQSHSTHPSLFPTPPNPESRPSRPHQPQRYQATSRFRLGRRFDPADPGASTAAGRNRDPPTPRLYSHHQLLHARRELQPHAHHGVPRSNGGRRKTGSSATTWKSHGNPSRSRLGGDDPRHRVAPHHTALQWRKGLSPPWGMLVTCTAGLDDADDGQLFPGMAAGSTRHSPSLTWGPTHLEDIRESFRRPWPAISRYSRHSHLPLRPAPDRRSLSWPPTLELPVLPSCTEPPPRHTPSSSSPASRKRRPSSSAPLRKRPSPTLTPACLTTSSSARSSTLSDPSAIDDDDIEGNITEGTYSARKPLLTTRVPPHRAEVRADAP